MFFFLRDLALGPVAGPRGHNFEHHSLLICTFAAPLSLTQGYDLLRVACIIIMPLLAAEKVAFMSHPAVLGLTNALFPWKGVDPSTL